jgi:hypothetical protein
MREGLNLAGKMYNNSEPIGKCAVCGKDIRGVYFGSGKEKLCSRYSAHEKYAIELSMLNGYLMYLNEYPNQQTVEKMIQILETLQFELEVVNV